MHALWYDVFKDGKTLDNAPRELLLEENKYAWRSTAEAWCSRFFPLLHDEEPQVRGAVVHLDDIKSHQDLLTMCAEIPWIKHGFADGRALLYGNFVSVQKLFNQNRKYAYDNVKHISRLQPFTSDPTVTWYAIITAEDVPHYDDKYGIEDAFACFQLLKGPCFRTDLMPYTSTDMLAASIAEEVFDIHAPDAGKVSLHWNLWID